MLSTAKPFENPHALACDAAALVRVHLLRFRIRGLRWTVKSLERNPTEGLPLGILAWENRSRSDASVGRQGARLGPVALVGRAAGLEDQAELLEIAVAWAGPAVSQRPLRADLSCVRWMVLGRHAFIRLRRNTYRGGGGSPWNPRAPGGFGYSPAPFPAARRRRDRNLSSASGHRRSPSFSPGIEARRAEGP